MGNYCKNILWGLGYAALAGIYGAATVSLVKLAMNHRDAAYANRAGLKYSINVTGPSDEAAAVHMAATAAAESAIKKLSEVDTDGKKDK